jgi:hypothetical protein
MSPLLILLIETLGPLAVEQVIRIYESIADDPGTPADVAARAQALVVEIQALNIQIAAAPLPGDEP